MFLMYFIPVLVAFAIFGLVIALLEDSGKGTEQQEKRIDDISQIDNIGDGPAEKVSLVEKVKSGVGSLKKNKKNTNVQKKKKNKKQTNIDDMLLMVQSRMSSEQFMAVKLASATVGALLAMIISRYFRLDMSKMTLALAAGGLVGMIVPGRWLTNKVKNYQESIRMDLPDVMDLLVVSVEAGLGFDAALMRLYEKNQSILMEELMEATRDIQRGVSKKEAYTALSKRCKVKEFTTFLTAMIQADQLGTPIKSVLKSQAEMLRAERTRRAEKKAKEAPVKMLIPMVIFIFPVIFIVLLGPAAMTVWEVFSG
jgi:tight adherence protein C